MQPIHDRSSIKEEEYFKILGETHPGTVFLHQDGLSNGYFIHRMDTTRYLKPAYRFLSRVPKVMRRFLSPRVIGFGSPFEPYVKLLADPTDAVHDMYPLIELGKHHQADMLLFPNIRHDFNLPSPMVPMKSFPNTVLELNDCTCFDDYLARLTQGWRSSVRRNQRAFREAGFSITFETPAVYEMPQIYKGYEGFYERAQIQWVKYSADYFDKMRNLNGVSWVCARDKEQKIVGALMMLNFPHILEAGRISIIPHYVRQRRIYFNLLYGGIAFAIRQRSQRLSLEPTSYKTKESLGAQVEMTRNWLYPLSIKGRLIVTLSRLSQNLLLPDFSKRDARFEF